MGDWDRRHALSVEGKVGLPRVACTYTPRRLLQTAKASGHALLGWLAYTTRIQELFHAVLLVVSLCLSLSFSLGL